jgi:hypothetical protein
MFSFISIKVGNLMIALFSLLSVLSPSCPKELFPQAYKLLLPSDIAKEE